MIFEMIDDNNKSNLLKSIMNTSIISMDTETTSLDAIIAEPLLIQFYINNNAYIINAKTNLKLAKYFLQLINNPDKLIILQNAKYDIKIAHKITGEWLMNVYDTMLGEVLINQGIGYQFYSLSSLTEKYLSIKLDKEIRKNFENHDGNFTNDELIYAVKDVVFLEKIREKQLEILEQQRQMRVVDLEMNLVPVVARMEYTGISFDKDNWENAKKEAEKFVISEGTRVRELFTSLIDFDKYGTALDLAYIFSIPVKSKKEIQRLSEIKDWTGKKTYIWNAINFSSPKQVKAILENLYGMKLETTNKKELAKYRSNPFIDVYLSLNDYITKVETFGDNFFDKIHPVTGKIHPEFNQLGTRTGRFSSNDPNMQQIPKENIYRNSFIATPGYKIITVDYSQAELRILAAISKEKEMIDAFINGIDLHTKTASILYEIPVDAVTKNERKYGKALNFAVVYGSTEYGLANNFGISVDKARNYIEKFFYGYKNLAIYNKKIGDMILERYYSITPIGRKRFFNKQTFFGDYRERERYLAKIIREGRNHVIQGGSADIIKMSMVDIEYNKPFSNDDFRILLQEHDELVFEVKEDIVEDAVVFIKHIMTKNESLFLGDIPAIVDIFVADSWDKED